MKYILSAMLSVVFAIGAISAASARLQLSINVGASTFTCFDGQLGCDQNGGLNNLLVIDQTVDGAFIQVFLAQSQFGDPNTLQLSSSNIKNTTGSPITITLLGSDTNFIAPVEAVRNSASMTFNHAVGSGVSTLKFWADASNTQGANPNNTPGTLLETVSGTPITDPDSFSGSNTAAFTALAPFSMTEGAQFSLIGGGSITGLNLAMQTVIPEPSTWTMGLLGFGLLVIAAGRQRRKSNNFI